MYILLHEYRKMIASVFTHTPLAQNVRPDEVDELNEVLELRLDGFETVPPPPHDFSCLWDLDDAELLNAGLMPWIQGTGWKLWTVPFEWRFAIASHSAVLETFLWADGTPFPKAKWEPDTVRAMFGMLAMGPLVGDFMKFMVESHYIYNATFRAGDVEVYPDARRALVELGTDRRQIELIDELHDYLSDHCVLQSA